MDLGLDDLDRVDDRYVTDSEVYARGVVSSDIVGGSRDTFSRVSISPEGATLMRNWASSAIYTGLRALVGEFQLLEDTDVVPVTIATKTKPIIAAYLLAAHYEYDPRRGWAGRKEMKEELADRMDVTDGTFQEYIARARREAMEYRVGGSVKPYWA